MLNKATNPMDEILNPLQPTYINVIRPLFEEMAQLLEDGKEGYEEYYVLDNKIQKVLIPFNEEIMKGMVKYPEHIEDLREFVIANTPENRDQMIELYIQENSN